MLCKISFKNIKRSIKDYAIYFFTLVIGVSVFYIFNAIGTQAAMLRLKESQNEIIGLLKTLISGFSVFVAIILALLIIYSSRFLMKRRNKEFAVYMLLGMGKGKISAILLTETIMIGLGSLVVGLIIGVGVSQFMSAIVASLFAVDMTEYKFTFSGSAAAQTVLYFTIMYIVVMLFNSASVTKMKLIDLIQSGKRSEKIKVSNPVLSVIIFLLASAGLAWAYYKVAYDFEGLSRNLIITTVITGAVCTFLIFLSVSGFLLRIFMSFKKSYFNGLNTFTFRQISSKVNTMVFAMTVICLMLFVTICALSSAFSVRNAMNAGIKKYCPVDAEISFQLRDKNTVPIFVDMEEAYKN
ncbi:MAG: FtsX-like permease family protein, partial [Lachnospiraceae bacterium]|nr:FtsX-like permease family protein [Lachnospiraceae bacterium]